MYFPFKPIKGVAFTFYFTTPDGVNPPSTNAITYCGISKDGGAFTATTNAPVMVATDAADSLATRYKWALVLTATEMTAGIVIIATRDSATGAGSVTSTIIHTTDQELSAVPTLTSPISDKVTAIFQYLFYKRNTTASAQTILKSDSATLLATAVITDDGTTVSKGKLS